MIDNVTSANIVINLIFFASSANIIIFGKKNYIFLQYDIYLLFACINITGSNIDSDNFYKEGVFQEKKMKKTICRARFNPSEDEIIKYCVNLYGAKWIEHAIKILGNRHSERAIRERYKNYIDIHQKRTFTQEEDEVIYKNKRAGKSFKDIAKSLGNTSAQHIRIRYNKILKKKGILPLRKQIYKVQFEVSHEYSSLPSFTHDKKEVDINEFFQHFFDEINDF